jgi:hypothetical protein
VERANRVSRADRRGRRRRDFIDIDGTGRQVRQYT